ncbi:fatty acid synthase-like [Leptopilina heterotoma]|uniref:fatty acid synthase-like n=1 Tax=Leptopilina heterotoma TaxID=63436 RepID=UPI001CA822BB|nr:fatty acid synthase-like [Leptopilina heterotoma]
MESTLTGEEIVISGIAGRFPNSDNINELQNNLFNKIDCVSDSKNRWDFEHPQIPERIGTMKNINKYDRVFFGVHGKMINSMDPMIRIITEIAYEAIADAGINPKSLKGSNSAVITGSSFSESENATFYEKLLLNGYGIIGTSHAMLANRISFFLGLTGPSVNLDTNCCASATALQEGVMALKSGRAENAIIGASNVILHPQMSLQLFLLGLLSPDGITKSFDNEANGYTRSEGTVVLFLQKARDAKRIYAEVKNVECSFAKAINDKLLFYPTHDSQTDLMRKTLKDCDLSGRDISYVEADGSGIKDIDAEEVRAINEVYNEERNSPLLLGSIKSNIGCCLAVNPLNGIIKVITAMESGHIPPNLHFKTPSDKIPALTEGRCKVVTESTPWNGDYAVINNFTFGGVCSNIVLKKFKNEKKNNGKPDDRQPRLVTVSGCTEKAVNFLLSDLESRPVDVEMLQLVYDVFETETPSHLYRGYTLLPSSGLLTIKTRNIQNFPGVKREIWYMFSGMGSQWVGMGKALLQIPVFAEAIKKCDKVLKPHGIDIVRIITDNDPKIFDNIVHSFVGIAAIQIGLVDVLDSVGLKPDFLIGHSVGELGCAYADGCFTAEQMVLAALSRGLASVETEMPRGSMAAVGLGYEEIKNLCPPDIDVACHNSSSSSTISGPADSMKTFVKQLQEKKIFAKEVACSNIAYHSRYIAPAGEKLKKYLQEVIPNPKRRSNRWVSSSVPRDEWDSARAHLSSAEYHTNNLLNPVLFAETAKSISPNAVVIEIAPQGLMQAIVKRSFPKSVINIPLTKRDYPENVSFLFEAIGKLYNTGCNIKISNLYPKVSYPVSRGTPSISPLIQWDHSVNWKTSANNLMHQEKAGYKEFTVNLNDEKWKFLNHARIEGKIVIPITLYLKLAWSVLKLSLKNSEYSLVYHNVQIHKQQVEIPSNKSVNLVAMVQTGSGYFQVTNNENLLCSGILQVTSEENRIQFNKDDKIYQGLSENEIYVELQMRGLQYSGPFRSIHKSSINGRNGNIFWQDNWTTFLDGMIQMFVLGNDTKNAQVLIKIRNIFIDTKVHKEITTKTNGGYCSLNKNKKLMHRGLGNISAGGVQMEGVVLESILNESWRQNIVIEEILPDTMLGTYKHSPIYSKLKQVSNWKAEQLKSSDLNSISWIEELPTKVENKVKVEYSSVNEDDILPTESETSLEDYGKNRFDMKLFGQEYSGINAQGSRVMGIVPNNAFANYTIPDNDLTWKIPNNWSLEDAVTVPLAYATAYLALMIKGKLDINKSVFVYDGACSIGQAIINLALDVKSKIFIGYNSHDDKNFLKQYYPNILDNHFIEINKGFRNQIFTQTELKGVDLVIYNEDNLSNLDEWFLYVRRSAKFIVIGNLQKSSNTSIGMSLFRKHVTMSSVIPKNIIKLDLETKLKLSEMMKEGISSQIVKPLPKRVYSRLMLKDAFIGRASKDISHKIIVKVQPDDEGKTASAVPRFFCRTKGSYLILNGLNYFGLNLIELLVARGAENILIAIESNNTNAFLDHRLNVWRKRGVVITILEGLDFTDYQSGNAHLKEIGTVDAIFDLQRLDNSSERSSNSKYLFTKHLFEESKQMCPNLRHFVVFLTSNHIGESIGDTLLGEIDLTQLFQSKGVAGLLILLGPVTGIAEETTENEGNEPLLSIPGIIEQIDILLASNATIVSVSKLDDNSKKMEKENVEIESERSKFENYINSC